VPTPYQFIDGVLIMELICDEAGDPAPRLGDVRLERPQAEQIYDQLLREVVRMLCAGVVHGDLSDFNVLLGPEGPVIIDFPQAVNAASSQNARKLLLRDVDNLHRFLSRFAPERRPLPYAEEMWQLYQRGELTPDVRLSGRYRAAEGRVDTDGVLLAIADAAADEHRRRARLGQNVRGPAHPGGERRDRSTVAVHPERPTLLQSSHTRDRGRQASAGGQHNPRDPRRTSGPTPIVQSRRGPPNPKQQPFPQPQSQPQRRVDAVNTARGAADAPTSHPRKRRRRRRKPSGP
jgi:RIO kinase 1